MCSLGMLLALKDIVRVNSQKSQVKCLFAGQRRVTVLQRSKSSQDTWQMDAHGHNPQPVLCPQSLD